MWFRFRRKVQRTNSSRVLLFKQNPVLNNVLERAGFIDIPTTYNSEYEYVTAEAYFNQSQYARTLPPVPLDCPTPMGVAGNFEYILLLYNSFITKSYHICYDSI